MAQHYEERAPLLAKTFAQNFTPPKHISVIFAVACIIDQFGVNPIIVLPRGIILCGWVGYPLALFVFSLTIYTAMLLGKCWVIAEHLDSTMFLKNRYAYAALTEMAWGRGIAKIVNILINISVFSSNIPALLIVCTVVYLNGMSFNKSSRGHVNALFKGCLDNILPLYRITKERSRKTSQNLQFFDVKISNYNYNFSYCYWLIILGVALCPLTWLGSPKDTKWISVLSSFSVFTCALLTWFSMFSDATRITVYKEVPSPNWQGVSVALGILTFQFGCHPAILTIQTDMHDKRKLSRSILLSFFATGGLSMITIWMSSILYGSGTHANLTQGLPVNLILYFDILIVTLQLFLSTIVGQCTLFQDIEDKLKVPRELCWQRCVVRSLVVMFAIIFAEALPRFDLVMGVIGGILTGPITLIFPPLLYIRLRTLAWQNQIKSFIQKENFLSKMESQVEGQAKKSSGNMPTYKIILKKVSKAFPFEISFNEEKPTTMEIATVFFIVGFGILQTVTATYYSTTAAIRSTKFLPPCMINVDAASGIINA